MPIRETPLENDHYYHIYNRGSAKQDIFLDSKFYFRFERTLSYYLMKNPPLRFSKYLQLKRVNNLQPIQLQQYNSQNPQVEIIAYCFMPNHYHLLVKQCTDNGISNFMRKVGNSYTKYFNTKTNRVGPVFQGPFKAINVDSESYILQLSRYIHLNPYDAKITSKIDTAIYPYSSLKQYLCGIPAATLLVKPDIVLNMFGKNKLSYQNFCLDINDYSFCITRYSDILFDLAD